MADFIVKETGGGSAVKGGDFFKDEIQLGPQVIDFDTASDGIPAAGAQGSPTLRTPSRVTRLRVISTELHGAGVFVVKALRDNLRDYDPFTASGQAALGRLPSVIPSIGATDVVLMDINILADSNDGLGIYYAGFPCNGSPTDWNGAIFYRSIDGGGVFAEYGDALETAVRTGFAETVLAAPATNRELQWDRVNTVDVKMLSDATLTNTSLTNALKETNVALLGTEIISFTTAVDNGGQSYTLSELVRGRFGTEAEVGNHSLDDTFTMLEVTTLHRTLETISEIGEERQYKAISIGGLFDDGNVNAITNTGNARKPYSVANMRATRDGSFNIDATWSRRSRYRTGFTLSQGSTLSDNPESYEIDIYDSTFATFKRTLTSTTQAVQYTVGDQTTDFGGAEDPVGFRIFQMNADIGRGYPRQAVL